jgi:hypothetical protein
MTLLSYLQSLIGVKMKVGTYNFAMVNVSAGAQFAVAKPNDVEAGNICAVTVYQGGGGAPLVYTGYSSEGLLFRNLGTSTLAVSASWRYKVTEIV